MSLTFRFFFLPSFTIKDLLARIFFGLTRCSKSSAGEDGGDPSSMSSSFVSAGDKARWSIMLLECCCWLRYSVGVFRKDNAMILLSKKSVCFRTDADIRIKGCLFRSQVYDGTKSRLYENTEDGGNGGKEDLALVVRSSIRREWQGNASSYRGVPCKSEYGEYLSVNILSNQPYVSKP